jgi:ATP diphosphatase
MVRRHPHVFASGAAVGSAEAQTLAWEDHKKGERAAKGKVGTGLLEDVPRALPALMRAEKLQKRASTVGFDWKSADRVLEKVIEEAHEIVDAQASGAGHAKLEDEIGDLLFVIANLARHLKVDPEKALSGTNEKFLRRFRFVETSLRAEGRTPADASLDEMEALWQAAKKTER